MPDMNEFLELAHRAGIGTLNSLAIAEALEISTSYVQKLRSGSAPLRPPIRAKLGALIAAKVVDNRDVLEGEPSGPQDDDPVEQFEVDLQAVEPGSLPANGVSRFKEPVDLSGYSGADRFAVIDAMDGTAILVEIIEPFNNHTAARKICALLNKGGG